MDVRLLVTVLRFYYSALNYLFPFRRNTERKNLFLSVCHCLDQKINMREMNILYPHGGLIGYGNSKLDTLVRFSNVFPYTQIYTMQLVLFMQRKEADRVTVTCLDVDPPSSCVLGHITGLLYCLYLKMFVPSFFNQCDC